MKAQGEKENNNLYSEERGHLQHQARTRITFDKTVTGTFKATAMMERKFWLAVSSTGDGFNCDHAGLIDLIEDSTWACPKCS